MVPFATAATLVFLPPCSSWVISRLFQLESVSLWQIRLMLFVKSELKSQISHIQTSTVATGIANAMGNKGAVGVSFFLGGTALCFINCHLAAGSMKWAKRNANYYDIISKLQLGQKRLSVFDSTNQFHHVFWSVATLSYSRSRGPISCVFLG
jgi:hypothetical protein